MTVFVDDWRQQARVGHLEGRWSQLFAGPDDQPGELHAFAASTGLRHSWFQDKSWPRAHYDVTESERQQAIARVLRRFARVARPSDSVSSGEPDRAEVVVCGPCGADIPSIPSPSSRLMRRRDRHPTGGAEMEAGG